MSGTSNISRDKYIFKKLQGSHNYKKWTQDMSFALEETRLQRHVEGTAIALLTFEAKKDNSEDRMEKIYARQKKIVNFEDNACKAIAKTGKMCMDIVQKEFFQLRF